MLKVPQTIRDRIGDQKYTLDTVGCSGSRVFCFETMVLKAGAEEKEYRMLQWLSGKIPVPEVLAFERMDGVNYLLMSRAEGEMLCSDRYLEDPDLLVSLLAQGMRMLWNVDVTECPYRNRTEEKLLQAQFRVDHELCTTEDAEPGTYGPDGFQSPRQLLQWLKENKPREEPVFSHGDFCLPNLFAANGKITAFLDLGYAGTADRYQDIALCYRSLIQNFQGKYSRKESSGFSPDSLFEALSISPDREKLRYYILLDELF